MPITTFQIKKHSKLTDVSTPHAAADVFESFEKVADEAVSGSAATTLQVTGLDLDTDRLYFIRILVKNAIAGAMTASFEINGDTTATNYYRQSVHGNGTSISASRVNSAVFSSVAAQNDESVARVWVERTNGGLVAGQILATTIIGSGVRQLNNSWLHNVDANMTSAEITADSANGLAVGTRMIIYKVSR